MQLNFSSHAHVTTSLRGKDILGPFRTISQA